MVDQLLIIDIVNLREYERTNHMSLHDFTRGNELCAIHTPLSTRTQANKRRNKSNWAISPQHIQHGVKRLSWHSAFYYTPASLLTKSQFSIRSFRNNIISYLLSSSTRVMTLSLSSSTWQCIIRRESVWSVPVPKDSQPWKTCLISMIVVARYLMLRYSSLAVHWEAYGATPMTPAHWQPWKVP